MEPLLLEGFHFETPYHFLDIYDVIFSDLIEYSTKVFIDDFSVFGESFKKMLERSGDGTHHM